MMYIPLDLYYVIINYVEINIFFNLRILSQQFNKYYVNENMLDCYYNKSYLEFTYRYSVNNSCENKELIIILNRGSVECHIKVFGDMTLIMTSSQININLYEKILCDTQYDKIKINISNNNILEDIVNKSLKYANDYYFVELDINKDKVYKYEFKNNRINTIINYHNYHNYHTIVNADIYQEAFNYNIIDVSKKWINYIKFNKNLNV